jgi:hypothetical protein
VRHSIRNHFPLLLWVLGILFPIGWLGRFSPAFRLVFDRVFGPLWMHIFMHALLFAGLMILLVVAGGKPVSRRSAWKFLAAALLAGLLQEGFQAWSQGSFSAPASLFDLGVDLAGGLLGLGLAAVFYKPRTLPPQEV